MGMFDYTYHKCPACRQITENQSKAGPCSLNHYYYGDIEQHLQHLNNDIDLHLDNDIELQPAPLELVQEAATYELTCEHCNHKSTITIVPVPYYIH